MNLLALDLGTKTGYALETRETFSTGTWTLASPKSVTLARKQRLDRLGDPRISIFWDALNRTNFSYPLDWIFFEDVQFATSVMQAQLWSSFRSALWIFAHLNRRVRVECCPVGTLKKFATGTGAADKDHMARALCKKDPRFRFRAEKVQFGNQILDDNAVDAVHLLQWGKQIISRL